MKAAGLVDLTIDELIALKTEDVTPEYVPRCTNWACIPMRMASSPCECRVSLRNTFMTFARWASLPTRTRSLRSRYRE